MRGTLHLIAPEDLGWLLGITSERVIRGMAGGHRELGIAAEDVQAARKAAPHLDFGGGAATRDASGLLSRISPGGRACR